jgi:hypothetical protein
MSLTFEIICVCLFGSFEDASSSFGVVTSEMTNPLRIFLPFYRALPLQRNLQVDKAIASLRRLAQQSLIADRKSQSSAFRAALRSCNSELGEAAVVDNLISFIFAGHETTSSLLSFALYHLAKDEDLQDQVLLEMDPSSPYKGGRVFSAFLKEVLRMYPPAPAIGRVCTQSSRLPSGDEIPVQVRSRKAYLLVKLLIPLLCRPWLSSPFTAPTGTKPRGRIPTPSSIRGTSLLIQLYQIKHLCHSLLVYGRSLFCQSTQAASLLIWTIAGVRVLILCHARFK